jgi:hypothetical protein
VELLKSQLQKAEALKRFLIARKNEWKTQLEKFGLAKNFKKLSKTVYYYQQQLAEYKNILNDPRKIERKALELLSKTKPWKDFLRNILNWLHCFGCRVVKAILIIWPALPDYKQERRSTALYKRNLATVVQQQEIS